MGPGNSLFLNHIFRFIQAITTNRTNTIHKDDFPLGLDHTQEGYLYMLEDLIHWISNILTTTQEPFLGYFHLLPPHEAYKPRTDHFNIFANDGYELQEKPLHFFSDNVSTTDLEEYSQRYDEYIAFVDAEFGRLCDTLEKNGLFDLPRS